MKVLKDLQQIRDPFPGVITSRTAENSTLVSPEAGQRVFTSLESGILRVFVDVLQTYYRYIKIGMPATIVVSKSQNKLETRCHQFE